MLHLEVAYRVIKPQSHQAYDQVTTYLRPKNGPIVEITYGWSHRSYDWSHRSWAIARQISRSKVVVMFKTQSHRAYDQVTTYLRSKMLEWWANRRNNVRLVAYVVRLVTEVWVIARGKSVATRSMVIYKTGRATLRSVVPPINCSLTLYNVETFLGFRSLPIRRPTLLIVRSIVYGYH